MHDAQKLSHSALGGKRYIAYARCATDDGSAVSLQRQIHAVRQYGDGLGMHCVDEIRLAGIDGCSPVLRNDLRDLLARKREKDDFDVLMMEDYSRLTRSRQGDEVEKAFASHGVELVFVAQALLDLTALALAISDYLKKTSGPPRDDHA